MKFDVEKRERKISLYYPKTEFEIARVFAKKVYDEFSDFLKAVVLFGSVTKEEYEQKRKFAKEKDVDILIIVDDVRIKFSQELATTYRVILEKIIADTEPNRLHIQSMRFTSFWEYIRAGDPVAINILRYGMALIDTGFFDPLQALLDEGRIRPSKESVYTYFTMAPASIQRSRQHLLTAMMDLYWATIDSAHAALMHLGYIPPSPEDVADMIEEKLVKPGYVSRKYANTMRTMYKVFKQIVHRDIKEVEGRDYDKYKYEVQDFVKEMKKFIEGK